MAEAEIALEIRDLKKYFGGIKAVDGCTFEVPKGKISGLIGPNGSGKTTTFNLLTGVLQADSGSVLYNGEDIVGLKPHKIFNKGISRTFQITRIYREMTVFENMLSASSMKMPLREARVRAEQLMEFVTLTKLRGEYGGNLSYGQQKLLEFARALMTDPDLILLDEPAAGVNRTLLNNLLDHIHHLQEDQGKDGAHRRARYERDHEPLRHGVRVGLRRENRRRSARGHSKKRRSHRSIFWT